MTINRV